MLIAVSVFEIAADDPGGSFGWGPTVAAEASGCFGPVAAGWGLAAVAAGWGLAAVAAAVPFGRDFVAVGVATFPLLLQVGRQAGIAYLGTKHRRRTAVEE